MKQWMVQLFRSVVSLVIVIILAWMTFSLRSQLKESHEKAKADLAAIKADAALQLSVADAQIEALAKQNQTLTSQNEALAKQVEANDPTKGVYVICRFDLKPEADLAEYTAKTLEVVPTVRAEDGCRFYSLLKDAETDWDAPMKNERVYWMLEKWDSVDALKAHLQTPHMKAYGPIGATYRQSNTFHVLTEAK